MPPADPVARNAACFAEPADLVSGRCPEHETVPEAPLFPRPRQDWTRWDVSSNLIS